MTNVATLEETKVLLSEKFLDKYPDQPKHMNEIGTFVFYRTYSRWLDSEGRRETYKEAIARAIQYNVAISMHELYKKKIKVPINEIIEEAETLFDNVFNLRQFLSGRTHWVGGADTGVASKFPLANFNCSFVNIDSWNDMGDLFYLLLVGTGVGFKATKKMAKKLPALRNDINIVHAEYVPWMEEDRIEKTILGIDPSGKSAKLIIGDSKEGWVDGLRDFFNILSKDKYKNMTDLEVIYNSVRPAGARLKTFGGTASGHEPLRDMFKGIIDVINGKFAPVTHVGGNRVKLRPIHILDIGNLIGNNVVVGGVRRTAEIFLADADDWEVILAKYGINGIWDDGKEVDGVWTVTKTALQKHEEVLNKLDQVTTIPDWMLNLKLNDKNARSIKHRRMSNNSIGFEQKPSREILNLIFTIMRYEGEPGFVNLQAAGKRRYNAEGLNPCAEILLDTYGVCNLTTVNVDAFVIKNDKGEYYLDMFGLMAAMRLAARAGVRMTCLDLELPHWDAVHKRDRLTGVSMTGWRDAMEKLEYGDAEEAILLSILKKTVQTESVSYSAYLRIPAPLLDTTIKPEGTLSQVAGGVSSGLHASHSPFYIRRIRVNASDALVKVAMELGWTVNPEVGETWLNAKTLVIDFPVASGAKRTKDDVYIDEQFDRYFRFQEHYTAHNSSNTIHVRDNEWSRAEEIVWDRWDDFIGVSFLSYDNHSYELAPYEAITEDQYWELKNSMKPFDPSRLERWETDGISELTDESCADGACAPR